MPNWRIHLILKQGALALFFSAFFGCTLSDHAGVTECGNPDGTINGVTECGNTEPIAEVSVSSQVVESSTQQPITSSIDTTLISSSGESSSSVISVPTNAFEGVATYDDGTLAVNAEVIIRTQGYLADPVEDVPLILAAKRTSDIAVVEQLSYKTDETGRFSISYLPPGNYNIEVNDNVEKAAMQAITVHTINNQINRAFILKKYATVTGAVEKKEGETAYAKVYGMERIAEVDESGRYLLDKMPPGDYKVRIDFIESVTKSEDVQDSIQLEEDEEDFIPTEMKYLIYVEDPVENSINFWTQTSVEFQDTTVELGGGDIGIFPYKELEDLIYTYYPKAFQRADDTTSTDDDHLRTEGANSYFAEFKEATKEPGSVFFYFPNLENVDWVDQGIAHRRDLRPWMHQNLVFDILTVHNMQVKVGSRESDIIDPENPEDIDVLANIFEFGASTEWKWETVSVPLSHFTTADFSKIKVVFFIQYAGIGDAFIDNIRFEPVPVVAP